MKKIFIFVFLVLLVCAAAALAENKSLNAVAVMKGTAPDSPIGGTVHLTETENGLLVEAELKNIANPGPHGFHIHEVGNCGEMVKAAGGHFNPDKVMHGMLMKDGPEHAHAGDMGNIIVDKNGTAKLALTLPDVGLANWHYNVAGLSIILHEKMDDFGQPTGNAGGRIACGIIEVKK